MPWMDWTALKHSAFVHLPIAAALLLPIALVAAQRPGRGIKPWWITCRYLSWAGILGSLPALLTGLRDAYLARYLAQGQVISTGTLANPTLFQLHQWLAGGSVVLGFLTLRALYRRREEHQGIGPLGLLWGLVWCAAVLSGAFFGTRLARPQAAVPVVAEAPKAPVPLPAVPALPAASEAPWRLLDYASLAPTQAEPVKSPAHGNRWIRVWVEPKAMEAYQEGRPLPPGTLVAMSTVEDRWGRPGYEPGPIYGLEIRPDGKPDLTFYWASVPEARRNETGGQSRVYWKGADPNLKSCMECHRDGMGPFKDRSKWVIPRPKPKTDETAQ